MNVYWQVYIESYRAMMQTEGRTPFDHLGLGTNVYLQSDQTADNLMDFAALRLTADIIDRGGLMHTSNIQERGGSGVTLQSQLTHGLRFFSRIKQREALTPSAFPSTPMLLGWYPEPYLQPLGGGYTLRDVDHELMGLYQMLDDITISHYIVDISSSGQATWTSNLALLEALYRPYMHAFGKPKRLHLFLNVQRWDLGKAPGDSTNADCLPADVTHNLLTQAHLKKFDAVTLWGYASSVNGAALSQMQTTYGAALDFVRDLPLGTSTVVFSQT